MKNNLKQFIGFAAVGGSNVVITYGIYYILLFLGLNYRVSNTIGYIAGILNSYYWNNRYVFKNKEDTDVTKITKVFICYLITYVINTAVLNICIELLGISVLVAPAFAIAVTLPINFILNKYWAFREKRTNR